MNYFPFKSRFQTLENNSFFLQNQIKTTIKNQKIQTEGKFSCSEVR